MRYYHLLYCLLMLMPLTAAAQQPSPLLTRLAQADTIECTLSQGSNTTWSEQGQIGIEPAEFGHNGFFIVSAIDYKKRTASVHWPDFSHPVTLIPSNSGVSFIYAPDRESMFITTVFAETMVNSARFKVTHSRHIYLNGRALPSQYSGYCLVN